MSFKDLTSIKSEYRTMNDDVVNDFYIPVLKESISYKRAVGYFSSSILIEITKGLANFIKSSGKMLLIASPLMSPEDVEEIEKGYLLKKKIEKNILDSIFEPPSENEIERLSWIAYMISKDLLDIKLAYVKNTPYGIYHEKMGIFQDNEGNKIAFSGSLNDTYSALFNNYESFDVFESWKFGEIERIKTKEKSFDLLWENNDPNMIVLDFPEAAKNKLLSFRKDGYPNFNLDKFITPNFFQQNSPIIPKEVELYDYQIEAIDNWESKDFKGIFDMATGTGKTLTGLGAITRLWNAKKRCVVIIVCPYQHLVEQWVHDINKFNINPIIGYSASSQKKWKEKLRDNIIEYNLKITNFFCFITTNSTFKSDFVQDELYKIEEGKLLVVDEAHNFGATGTLKTLSPSFEYRLALSATLERHNDLIGTEKLYEFFGEKCIEYGIERAIQEDKLTTYKYFPVVVTLEEDEYEEYILLSKKITAAFIKDKDGNVSEQVKMLLIKRSRVIAGARNKINKLKELLNDYRNESHILVYCGATKVSNVDHLRDNFGERQITEVSKMMGNELNIINTHFTSNEKASEREIILEKFANANPDHMVKLVINGELS